VTLNSVQSINVAAGVTGVQTINLANNTSGSLLFPSGNFLSITNDSTAAGTTLAIGPNTVIGTPGSGGVIFAGAGTTNLSGSFATVASGNNVIGGLYVNGPGSLILSNSTNSYTGGTFVNAGTLMLGSGTAIPTGTNVTVATGGQFNISNLSNSAGTAIGTLALSGTGTFRVPSGNADYHLNQLQMTGGTMDFTGTNNFWLHFRNAGAAITTNASSTTATWIGAPGSRIQNDGTTTTLIMTVNSGSTPNGIDLDAGITLSSAGTGGQYFLKSGAGTMRLTSLSNTASIFVGQGRLRVDDIATGGVGALGSGVISLNTGTLQYGGPSATSTKPLTLSGSGTIQVLSPGANLQLNGVISETVFGSALTVSGPGAGGTSSTLTLLQNNNYDGPTTVTGNAVLAVPYIANGNEVSPIGYSSAAPSNLVLGDFASRGTLLLTDFGFSTNRGATVKGLYTSGSGGAIGVQNAGMTQLWTGQITGAGSLIKTGAGTLTLTNTTSNYTGGTYVEQGTLNVGAAGAVIPANSNVTVSSGGTFQIGFTSGSNATAPLGTLTLIGGTLRVPSGSADYYLNKLVMTGGTVDVSGTDDFYLYMVNAGAAITTNPSSITANWVGSPSSFILNQTGLPLTVSVLAGSTPSGIDLDAGINLGSASINNVFVKAGAGTMRLTNVVNSADFVVQQGVLRVDDVTTNGVGPLGSGSLTLNGGRLAYGGAIATLSKPFTVDAAGGGLDVLNAGTTLTVTSPVSSNGVLNKSGPGVLILNNLANTYAGGIAVSAGRLDVGNDNQLGQAAITVNPLGTLRFTSSTTTARTYTMFNGSIDVPSGVTLNMNGATVGGGFLRGNGTYALGGGTTLTGVTTFNSTTMNVTGPATAANFSNNGSITVNSGQTFSMNYATNGAAGLMTINGTANVGDFTSYGRLAINPGGAVNNTQSTMVFGGGSVTNIGIYNPANGQVTPGGTLNIGPGDMRVQGGFVRNNGLITGTGNLIIDYGAVVRGAGEIDLPNPPIRINGGQLLAGNSPGLTRITNFSLVSTGPTGGDFSNATGIAGPPIGSTGTQLSGWSVFEYGNATNTGGSAQVQGTPASKAIWFFQTVLDSGNYSTPGVPANFNHLQAYTWEIVRPRSAADVNNPTNTTPINTVAQISIFDTATMTTVPLTTANLNAYLRFDDSQWNWGSVPVELRGVFSFVLLPDGLGAADRVIALTYAPVPEARLVLGAAFVLFAGFGMWRRPRLR
jgi:autotransporter-associated beta strand protein